MIGGGLLDDDLVVARPPKDADPSDIAVARVPINDGTVKNPLHSLIQDGFE
jgi:SOS-response transcriptional repressor LexA